MIEALARLIATFITLGILIAPGVFIVWLFLKLLKKKNKRNNKPNYTISYNPGQYQTDWTWNEEKKLWEPPAGAKQAEHTAKTNIKEPTADTYSESTDDIDYRNAYQARQLFTKNEWQNYKKLREIAEVKKYVICPKVRLLDIIEPKKGEKKYKTLFYKIQAKHVDFVICDKDMYIKAIIELDDNSHDHKDRKARDEFVDLILHSVGYKVIHTRYITNDILDLV